MMESTAPTSSATERTAKRFLSGTHRTVAPAETFKRMSRWMAPFGITRVANVTGLDCLGIPVVMVCRPNARSLAVSQGKGVDLDAARASGLMEAIELYHAERVSLPLRLGSYNDLRFSLALAPVEALPRPSISRFELDEPLLWVEGLELHSADPRWVPYEMVHMNYTLPLPTGTGCFVMSSNGLASGNHPLEAVVHGLCELIERDAVTLWHLASESEREASRLDVDTVDDPACQRLLGQYARAGVSVGVWDCTSDLGVPTYLAAIVDASHNRFRPLGASEGMGCHPVREVALARALTEAAQSRLTLIAGSRDDNDRERYGRAHDEGTTARARQKLRGNGPRPFASTRSSVFESLEEDLGFLLGRLKSAGLEQAVAVDLSHAAFGIPVVRVIVPGLEPYHHVPGYVPGIRAQRVLDAAGKAAAS